MSPKKDSLTAYKSKRHLGITPEPEARISKVHRKPIFVVQEHHSRSLHYDFRLELNGVLKSWAIPKGLPTDPNVKHLAVQTEDHPFEYAQFHGVIPTGEYGAGTVSIWDKGTYQTLKDEPLEQSLKRGEITILLEGKKLKGAYALIRTHYRGDKNWLMIKMRDDKTDNHSEDHVFSQQSKTRPRSQKTSEIFSIISKDSKKKLKKEPMPSWIDPMLATLTDQYFSNPGWLYEHKWDGERILAYKSGKKVTLFTRNKKLATAIYPEIVAALESQSAKNFILDGEVVAFKHDGVNSDFSLLQNIMHSQKANFDEHIDYCIFDIMYLDGYRLTDLPLQDRKDLLVNTIIFDTPLIYTEHVIQDGVRYFHQACKKGWEGVIAKDAQSSYVPVRSKKWLKFKCINQQEFVIGGFTEPQNSRSNFGALLVGYYKNGKLMYAGKVGTGYNAEILQKLGKKLKSLEQTRCPFENFDISPRGVHWIKPVLVAEIKFAEWTPYDKLRHAVFMSLRDDKDPREVIQEKPKARVL